MRITALLPAILVYGFLSTTQVFSQEKPQSFPELKPQNEQPDRPTADTYRPSPSQRAEAEEEEDSRFPMKRNQWFLEQRAFPFEHVPSGARTRALQQYFAMKRTPAHSIFARPANAPRPGLNPAPEDSFTTLGWTFDGPASVAGYAGATQYSGRATSLAINPTTPSIMYLGTAGGGVWKTIDGGQSWNPVSDSQASLAIGAMAIDPNNPNIIYAGTGEADYSGDSYYGQGLLKSIDAGATWTLNSTFATGAAAAPFAQIAIQPGNSSVLLAATQSGVYRSTDSGTTWTDTLRSYASAVIFDPVHPNIAYAGMNGYFDSIVYPSLTSAIYKSTDGGANWTPLSGSFGTTLPQGNSIYRVALTIDSAGGILAGIAPSSYGTGTPYKSTDGGATWNALTQPGDGLDWYRDWIISVPGSPNILYTGGVDLFQSLDGGMTWARSSQSYAALLWADQHSALFSPDGSKMYLMDDGGVFMTSSPTATDPAFTSLNNGIGSMTFYPGFGITAGSPGGTIVGAQDHGTQIGTAGQAWSYAGGGDICGDGGPVILDSAGVYAYAHCQGSPLSAWMASPTAGAVLGQYYPYGWVRAGTGINPSDRTAWVPPMANDPSNPANVYAGTYRVYQSTDHAGQWTAISGDLTQGKSTLSTIAVAPTDANTIYAGSYDSTFSVTTNALAGSGATWTAVSGLPNRAISKVIVMPDRPQDVYVSISGFGSGHVFHSINGGTSWTDMSGNLPDSPANSVAVDPSLSNTVYVATDTGVFVTSNGGSNWEVLGANLPNVVVQDLQIVANPRLLRVVTHGRGAWDITLPVSGFIASTNLLAFGYQPVSATPTAQNVTLSNNSGTPVAIGSITATANFQPTTNCGSSLASGTSCTISVLFTPTSPGAVDGALHIVTGAGTLSVALTGTGTAPTATLSGTLTFPTQPVNQPSAPVSDTLQNNGNAPLTGIAVTITGADASDFSQTNTCGTSLTQGTACTISVVFTPAAGGSRTATLNIADNASGSPQNVSISGAGQSSSSSGALQFIPVAPCRPVDTRNPTGAFGGPSLSAGSTREFDIPASGCGIPSTAVAYSLNATVVPAGTLDYLTLWPAGQTQPTASTLNSLDGRIKANAAIVPAGNNGGVNVYVTDATNVILDIDGYFVPAGTVNALAFYPLTPCRVADTRNPAGPLGGPFISGSASRSFPVQSSACNIPSTAQAYSLNVTALPQTHLGYLTAWPSGQPQPVVSTLNAGTGAITADAAIVPAGTTATAGAISIYMSDEADLVLDVNGYFAPPATGGLSLYTMPACRVLDTRSSSGVFNGVLPTQVKTSTCAPPAAAQAYVLNATVVPPAPLTYLTLWPDGAVQPNVSTLNALDGAITSNMAIVPTSDGKIDLYSSNATQAILDLSSYFAP